MSRKTTEGKYSGMKQDRYRNSRFENEGDGFDNMQSQMQSQSQSQMTGGMAHKTINTLGGKYAENRGHRSATSDLSMPDSPFENGSLENWNHRNGWDEYYYQQSRRGSRNHGGAQIGHDDNTNIGRGPKGYKRPDERVHEDVCEMLSLSRDVDASDIEVEVKDGCVYLRGEVEDRRSKKMAELEVENISGVKDVQNLLTFKRG